jgi:hypothetical protein
MEQARGKRTMTEMGARGASESLRLQADGEASAIEARGRAAAEVIMADRVTSQPYQPRREHAHTLIQQLVPLFFIST